LETKLGRALIAGRVLDGAKIIVDVKNGEIDVSYENPAPSSESLMAVNA